MANKSTLSKKNSATGSSNKKQPTAAEMREWYAKNKKTIENFEKAKEALQLVDPTKSSNKTFNTFSKEKLRTYMKNPLTNYKNLRNLSKYLYYVSQAYRRMVHYYANMPDLRYRSIIPKLDLKGGFNSGNIDMQSYYDTLMFIDKIPLTTEFYKMLVTAWIEDASFGVAYFTENEDGKYDMFILPLPSDYCVITGLYSDGSIAFDFDMTYFNSKQELIEWWGYPFDQMYKEYQKDTRNNRYQPVPDDVSVALKVNLDTPDQILMPFMGMFSSLISLNDLVEISAIADEQEIYKLLSIKIPLINSDSPDDFAVDPETAIDYYNKLVDSLPDYTNAVLLPGLDIEDISFDTNKVNDVSRVEQATKEVFNTAGGGQVLHNANISGSTGLNLAMKTDELQALRPLLGEIEAIINRLISFKLDNPSKIKFLEVTKYTADEYKDSLIKSMNYGLPFAMTIGSLSGYSELDLLAMAGANESIGIRDLFKPMDTAATRSASNSEGGAPKKSDGEITSDGEASRDKRETAG